MKLCRLVVVLVVVVELEVVVMVFGDCYDAMRGWDGLIKEKE